MLLLQQTNAGSAPRGVLLPLGSYGSGYSSRYSSRRNTRVLSLADGEQTINKKQVPLQKGDDGVVQTIKAMRRLALRDSKDEQIITLARQKKGKTDAETVANIYDFVHSTWRYKNDPEREEHLTAPVHIVNNCGKMFGQCQHVDCDDFSTLLAALLMAAGFEVAFRVLSWRAKAFTHVYVLVRLPNIGWTPLDAVMKERGLFNEKDRSAHLRTLNVRVGGGGADAGIDDELYPDGDDDLNARTATLQQRLAANAANVSNAVALRDSTDSSSQSESRKELLKALWKCDKDGKGVSFSDIGLIFQNKDNQKKRVIEICQNETNCYIRKQIQVIVGSVAGALVIGGIGGYVAGRFTK